MRARAIVAAAVVIGSLFMAAAPAAAVTRDRQCRYQHTERPSWTHREVVRTVRCAALAFGNRADARRAHDIGMCESGLNAERAPHSTPYHGTFQYLIDTFGSQERMMPHVVRGYDLSHSVHNTRANVVMAVAWGITRSWSLWSCA